MATLETVMQMKQQGFPEPQIIQILQQQGVSPKEINEALSQSKIKSELGTPQNMQQSMQEPSFPGTTMQNQMSPQNFTQEMPTQTQNMSPQDMQQSMQPSMMQEPNAMPMQAPSPYESYPQYPTQPQQEMPYYEEYQPQQTTDLETINDIAEQIVEEKTENLKKQITNFTRFKDELSIEVEKINERLSRIENTFNQLQMAILGKIGEYGSDIQNISKEMHETQNSFSKIINPLTDNIRELQKITKHVSKSKKD